MIVVGVSSRKSGGKSTLATFLRENADDLWPVEDTYPAPITEVAYLPFAGPIKEFAVRVLGLEKELVYGTDEQKESLTEYLWEKMPHYQNVLRDVSESANRKARAEGAGMGRALELFDELAPKGRMTVRQILQEIGTGWGRCLDEDIWCKTWERDMLASDADVVIVDDFRFANEATVLKKHGAILVRLLRGRTDDGHISENSLHDDDPHWTIVIDNRSMTKADVNREVVERLVKLGRVEPACGELVLRKCGLWSAR